MTEREVSVVNPATGEDIADFKSASLKEVLDAVSRSRRAFSNWRFTSVAERAAYLERIAQELEAHAERIGTVVTSEMGRVISESVPEVTKSAAFFRYFAKTGTEALKPQELDLSNLVSPQKRALTYFEPRGVAAVIKPWNAPVQQIVWAVAPALIAGCTVIMKPSEYTPGSALELQAAIDRAGLPADVVITLVGDDQTGEDLIQADVDVIAFTGSATTGRHVAEVAGRRIRKAVLELSGKDALIVDSNMPDLDLVASGIVYGAFSNCGHWCSSVEHVYVPRLAWDTLVPEVVRRTRALRLGNNYSKDSDIGPIANARQFAIVSEIVSDAVERGAKVLTGGAATPGAPLGSLFYEPTILVDVPSDARLARENVFGPVVAIYPYDDVDEAIAAANATQYGLGLSVWTTDEDTASYIAKRSDTGMVWINEPLQSIAACPWSVTKDSGIGVELGSSGVREFTYEKVVQSQFSENVGPRGWYFPYGS